MFQYYRLLSGSCKHDQTHYLNLWQDLNNDRQAYPNDNRGPTYTQAGFWEEMQQGCFFHHTDLASILLADNYCLCVQGESVMLPVALAVKNNLFWVWAVLFMLCGVRVCIAFPLQYVVRQLLCCQSLH